MNILFFLTPKSDVSYVYDTDNVYNALKSIGESGFTAIPMISKSGKYIGAITEGDFLWNFIDVHKDVTMDTMKSTPVLRLKRRFQYKSVNVNADLDDLLAMTYSQNFVPIVDDRGIFIGIVTRQEIMKHYCKRELLFKAVNA
ncbi:MAG: CBS domain-containing protein [Acetivibrio sp.]